MATIPSLTLQVYLHSFSCGCLPKSRNSDKIWPYSSSRSSKVIDLGVNRKPTYDFLLVANSTVFQILTLKAKKSLNFSDRPFFEAPVRGEPPRIWWWNLASENSRVKKTYRTSLKFIVRTIWWYHSTKTAKIFWVTLDVAMHGAAYGRPVRSPI